MEHPDTSLACAHCAQPALTTTAVNDGPWFCCRGCREVHALLRELQEAA